MNRIQSMAYQLYAQNRLSEHHQQAVREYAKILLSLPENKEAPPFDKWISKKKHQQAGPLYADPNMFLKGAYLDQPYMQSLLQDKTLIKEYRHDLENMEHCQGPIGTTKEEWLQWHYDKRPQCRHDVLQFIANILFKKPDRGHDEEAIYDLFACGYCYYFALMLHHAFGGKMMWHQGYGHIVWVDENDVAYDIGGIFEDASVYDESLIPVEELGERVEEFLHRKKDHQIW